MQVPSELSNKVLKILSQNHTETYTLEELTATVFNTSSKSEERENQARVLDILLLLESEELISLNSLTDESQINIITYLKNNVS
jgi:hypothetical protein